MADDRQKDKKEEGEDHASGAGITPPQLPLISSRAGVIEVYSNFAGFSWTQYDVRLRFAQVIPNPQNPPGPEFAAEERVAVTLSWAHAKALAAILGELVKTYEQVNSPIQAPKIPSI